VVNLHRGLYRKMGITEFICDSEKEYILKAVEYGKNKDKQKKYGKIILENVFEKLTDIRKSIVF